MLMGAFSPLAVAKETLQTSRAPMRAACRRGFTLVIRGGVLIVFLLNSSSVPYLVKNLHRALPADILYHALKNVKRTVFGKFQLTAGDLLNNLVFRSYSRHRR